MFTKKRKLKKLPKLNFNHKSINIRKKGIKNLDSVEKKIYKLPKTNRIHILIVAFMLFFLGLIFYILKFQAYKIKSVDCFVENITCSENGISIPNLIGENFFKYDFTSLKNKLIFNYPAIKEIKTEKKFPCKFVIQISLRKPKAIIEDKLQNRYFIDDQAMVFSQTLEQKKDYIIIKTEESINLSEKIVSPNILFSVELVNYLESSLLPVKEIIIQSQENIKVILQNGKTIFFTTEKNIQKQVDSLIFILNNPKIDKDKKNIIDLRFENPIVK